MINNNVSSKSSEVEKEKTGTDTGPSAPSPTVSTASGKKRAYQPIWETAVARADNNNFAPVKVKIDGLSDAVFARIRKAFWKERDLSSEEVKKKYRAKVMRDKDNPDIIHFSVVFRGDWI